jgi:hypothetical protein
MDPFDRFMSCGGYHTLLKGKIYRTVSLVDSFMRLVEDNKSGKGYIGSMELARISPPVIASN